MKKCLRREIAIWHMSGDERIFGPPTGVWGDLTDVRGDLSAVRGDLSDVRGNLTGVWGDLSNVRGDVDAAELTAEEREAGVSVDVLIEASK